jgi:hypothetical protein
MADSIQSLPVDDTAPKSDEIEFFTEIFKTEKNNKVLSNNKDVLIAGILFFVFINPIVQNFIRGFVEKFSGCGNDYFVYLIISIIFMCIFFFVKNVRLSGK